MTQLTVVAKIKAKPGSEAVLHQELLQLIQPTLLEEGCLVVSQIVVEDKRASS